MNQKLTFIQQDRTIIDWERVVMNRRTRLVLFGVGLTAFVTTGMIMGGTGDVVTDVAWLGSEHRAHGRGTIAL